MGAKILLPINSLYKSTYDHFSFSQKTGRADGKSIKKLNFRFQPYHLLSVGVPSNLNL